MKTGFFSSEVKGKISSHWDRKIFLKLVEFLSHLSSISSTNSLGAKEDLENLVSWWSHSLGHSTVMNRGKWSWEKLPWIWRLNRYEELLKNLKSGTVFIACDGENTLWIKKKLLIWNVLMCLSKTKFSLLWMWWFNDYLGVHKYIYCECSIYVLHIKYNLDKDLLNISTWSIFKNILSPDKVFSFRTISVT